ncbi:MAG TPA: hypothetical protein ENL35_11460 [Chloroflexi bacterium]|nr:hypothetical protein [Chloroflexota bacterium]
MRTCTRCNHQSPDSASACKHCGADLSEFSATAVALKDFQANPRVSRIRVIVARDACPACRAIEGSYEKDSVPSLPVAGCSHANGCRCFYEPMLVEIFP